MLHGGTDRPRMMVVTLRHDGGQHAQTYRGFVSTYLETQTEDFQRLTYEDWRELLRTTPPAAPEWMSPIVASE